MATILVFANEKRRVGNGLAQIVVEHHLFANSRRRRHMWVATVDLDVDDVTVYLDALLERGREFARSRT